MSLGQSQALSMKVPSAGRIGQLPFPHLLTFGPALAQHVHVAALGRQGVHVLEGPLVASTSRPAPVRINLVAVDPCKKLLTFGGLVENPPMSQPKSLKIQPNSSQVNCTLCPGARVVFAQGWLRKGRKGFGCRPGRGTSESSSFGGLSF